jgi:hypothetical protein
MTQLEKRIQRLESLYDLDQSKVGMLWPECLFLRDFPEVFPDPNTAPPIARMTYLRLKQRWDRHWSKNPSQTGGPNLPKTDRKENI